jgi:transcriptional regulator with XRE-family HTH domain
MKTSHPNPALCRSLGLALKATRKAHPISLDRLSAASGVAMSCISVIERGESNPTIDTINRLAVALNTTPAGLLRYAEHLNPSTP